jgi:DNA-binding response OmpR family regulator
MEQKVKLLLAEDDENLGLLLKEYLVAKGYDASLYPDGEAAFKGFTKEHFDICVLDIMMPKKDGFTLAREIRMVNADIPVIFLTAKNLKDDVIEGFKLGADDYITKPFSMEELIFRIEAILRRTVPESQNTGQQIYKLGRFTFDARKQTLSSDEDVVKLTTKESDLLKLLCQNVNKVLERNFALKSIWIDDNYFNARSMDVYITKLRKHLKNETTIEIINVHGKGYKLIM